MTTTYAELERESCRVARTMKAAGVHHGDTVGLSMPMVPELVAVFYATLKIGAVLIPVFSGFGARALATRLQYSDCRIVFTADGSVRRGKPFAIKPDVDLARAEYPGVETVIVVDRLGTERHGKAEIEISMTQGGDVWWSDFLDGQAETYPGESLDAEADALILFTSGTTGRPKGTVHTHAGCLAQMARELGYAFDVKDDDVFFWVTDIGCDGALGTHRRALPRRHRRDLRRRAELATSGASVGGLCRAARHPPWYLAASR